MSLTKDTLILIAREIDHLPTLIAFSQVNTICRQIVNRVIAFKESKKIETDYYNTVIHNSEKADGLWLKCYVPEISDPSCHGSVYHGTEIIEIVVMAFNPVTTNWRSTINHISREWCMNKVIKPVSPIRFHPDFQWYIEMRECKGGDPHKSNCLQYIYSTETKTEVEEFHKRSFVHTCLVPTEIDEIEEVLEQL